MLFLPHPVIRATHLLLVVIGLFLTLSEEGTAGQNTPGAPAPEEACLKCHAPIQAILQRKFKHAAVEMGCSSCHADHRQAPAKEKESSHYLTAQQPDLCLTCHDAADAKLTAAHRRQPFEKSTCTSCHDPHASDVQKLIPVQQHGPYEARQCEGCHKPPKEGKVTLAAATANELCLGCHDDLKKRLTDAKSRHTLLGGENSCVDCHDPHASNRPHFLKQPQPALCNGCHADVTAGKKFVHAPAAIACTVCHDAHASGFTKNLHAQVNDLCLECHGTNAVQLMQEAGPMKLFDGRVTLPSKTFEELRYLELSRDKTRGHPFPNHPVLAEAKEGKSEITCLTCHKPHASESSPRLFVTDTPASTMLCAQCHK